MGSFVVRYITNENSNDSTRLDSTHLHSSTVFVPTTRQTMTDNNNNDKSVNEATAALKGMLGIGIGGVGGESSGAAGGSGNNTNPPAKKNGGGGGKKSTKQKNNSK